MAACAISPLPPTWVDSTSMTNAPHTTVAALKLEGGEHYVCDPLEWRALSSASLTLWKITNTFVVVGGTPSIGTGPSSAHNGTSYLYFEATERKFNDTAYVRINPMTHTDKIISLHYNGYGAKYVYTCIMM